MKSKVMAVVLATSLFTAVPSLATDAPSTVAPSTDAATAKSWGIGSMVSTVLNAPGSWHKSHPKITGTLALAVVAIIAYNLGKDSDEEKSKKAEELI